MNKIIAVVVVLFILITVKFLFKDQGQGVNDDMPPMQPQVTAKPEAGECIPMGKFMAEYPGATPEEINEMEACNKKRALKLGLNKRNTGFLSNRISRPQGALAHYEGSYGSFVFTLYKDHIYAKDIDEIHEIELVAIKAVKKSASAMIIDYETANGKLKHYGVTLLGDDDELKDEGNTDLDRLIELVNQLRGVDEDLNVTVPEDNT